MENDKFMEFDRFHELVDKLVQDENLDIFIDTVMELKSILDEFKYLTNILHYVLNTEIKGVETNINTGLAELIYNYFSLNKTAKTVDIIKYINNKYPNTYNDKSILNAIQYLKRKGMIGYDKSDRLYKYVASKV